MALLIESSLWRKTGSASPVIDYVTPDKPTASDPQFSHLRNGE